MKSAIPRHWSQHLWTWVFPVVVFAAGLGSGILLETTWEVDRHARALRESVAQIPLRPTLHDRLDALEQRLQAIQDQLETASRHE
jgi:hypothetical protein